MKQLALRLVVAALPVLSLSAQQPDRQTVRVPVTVMREGDGTSVIGLKVDDFTIQEDGIKQKVSAVDVSNNGYVVSYVPAPNPKTGFRTIKVAISVPGVIIRSRSGYFPRSSQ